MDFIVDAIVYLVIGLVAGWLATSTWPRRGFGQIAGLVLGILGAAIGGILWKVSPVAFGSEILWQLIDAVIGAAIGAVVVLALASLRNRQSVPGAAQKV